MLKLDQLACIEDAGPAAERPVLRTTDFPPPYAGIYYYIRLL